MNRLMSAIRLVFYLPPVWIGLVAIGLAIAANGRQPLVDIVLYALWRLCQ